MQFNEYQIKAKETAVYAKKDGLNYLGLGLCNESGEVAGKIKKLIRGDYSQLDEMRVAGMIADELGDVLWYLSMLADTLGYDLEMIAKMNVEKLRKRKEANTLKGDGDVR